MSDFEDFDVIEEVVQGLIEAVLRFPQGDSSRLVPETVTVVEPQQKGKDVREEEEEQEIEKEVQEVPDPTTTNGDHHDDDPESMDVKEPEFVPTVQLEIEVEDEVHDWKQKGQDRIVLGEIGQVQEVPASSNNKKRVDHWKDFMDTDNPDDTRLFSPRRGCLMDVYSIDIDEEDKENVPPFNPAVNALQDHSYASSTSSASNSSGRNIHAAIRVESKWNAKFRVGLSRSTPVPPLHPYLRRKNQNNGNR